ncbi:D-glycero-beta-D-manno-heptose 1-phosphate adenylyltransferase [Butyrivibrio fibrisolvens]|uniref:D-glycero-beta-D-manno-heptose 1-phosphate adenylyltransferase n=1 Tax=Butyrivibrio fibrisolvens TaxID=831 RepID=UPI000417600F|nr:D-glycero-beta-D-manno-heptose 1-phosphate adenylyltransferase [Butyrivibrio fibrisolvens]
MRNKIVDQDELVSIVDKLKREGKKVAATSGCFDILHAGHVTYLEKAKEKADYLILFLNTDNSVKSLKGESRPIVPENERAIVVAGLECIDYVCLFDEKTPCNVIEKVKPDMWIKGADYRGVDIPEKAIIEEYGGKIDFVDMVDGCSSTNIIQKIRNA